jgi:hypothetical protein
MPGHVLLRVYLSAISAHTVQIYKGLGQIPLSRGHVKHELEEAMRCAMPPARLNKAALDGHDGLELILQLAADCTPCDLT